MNSRLLTRSPRRRGSPARQVEAERLGGLEIDHHLELGGCLHRKVTSILTFEDAVDVRSRPPEMKENRRPVMMHEAGEGTED